MRRRGKSVKTEQDNSSYLNYFSSSSSNLLCKKHPLNPSSVGICAHCLKEKLIKLVCSDCGEQRLSSCSCSDISSYRNSSCTVDVGSVGRISFFIENDKSNNGDEQKTLFSHMKKTKQGEAGDVVLLKRSNSCVVEVKKSNGFWRIGKLFKKKREKECCSERNRCGFDQGNEVCVMDASRSRSVSSFMDGNSESAKVSDFNELEPRKSGIRGRLREFETDFSKTSDDHDDDSEFIDLKIDLCEKSKTEHSVFKKHDQLELISNCSMGSSSSSCRFMVNDRGTKNVKNNHMKAWEWILKHHSGNKELNPMLDS